MCIRDSALSFHLARSREAVPNRRQLRQQLIVVRQLARPILKPTLRLKPKLTAQVHMRLTHSRSLANINTTHRRAKLAQSINNADDNANAVNQYLFRASAGRQALKLSHHPANSLHQVQPLPGRDLSHNIAIPLAQRSLIRTKACNV